MRRLMISCLVVILLAPLFIAVSPSPVHAFCNDGTFKCRDQGHRAINDTALDFLSPGIRSRIKDKNRDQDSGLSADRPELHFTNCLFTRSTDYIRSQYDQVVAAVWPSPFAVPSDSFTATMRWGQLLHPVQDFYSHSPWVDPRPVGLGFGTTYPRRLLDSGLGNWRRLTSYEKLFPADPVHSDIVAIQGNYWGTGDLPRDVAGNPTSAVPNVDFRSRYRGLMTASAEPFTNELGQCPPAGVRVIQDGEDETCKSKWNVCIRHGGFVFDCWDLVGTNDRPIYDNCLQHDADSRPNWRAAFDSAVAQTEHEWCRLLNMTRDRGSYDAASILMALWVARDDRPYATPHPAGTACAPERKRSSDLRLTIEVEPRVYPNKLNLSFVAYTADFRQSVRTVIRTGGKTRASLDICINSDDRLLTTLWGWSDMIGGRDGSFDPWEPVLTGMTKSFTGPIFPSAEQVSATRDLRLKVKLSPDPSWDCRT